MFRTFCVLLGFGFALLGPAFAQGVNNPPKVSMALVSARTAVAPGEVVQLGLHQLIASGWHTYWVNPGDAAEPPIIEWSATGSGEVGPFSWPAPATFLTGEGEYALVSHVYKDEVVLPFRFTVPATARPGERLELAGTAIWQVCDDRTCIWEEGPVSLSLSVANSSVDDPVWEDRLAAIVAAIPRPLEGTNANIDTEGRLSLAGQALGTMLGEGAIRNAHFFPFDRDAINPNLGQLAQQGPQGLRFQLAPQPGATLGASPISGVVAFDQETPQGWVRRGFEVTAKMGPALPGTDAEAVEGGGGGASPLRHRAGPTQALAPNALTLPTAVLFALLAGLLLNVMPCVFPILSLKALGLANAAVSGHARRHGLWFLGGVLATFVALACVLIGLRAGGAALGWGFQLQDPIFMGGLALLFFVLGLNLLGSFEIGGGLQNLGGSFAGREGDAGAFFTGAVAVIAATPCTIPFMAGAMGFALAQPALVALFVFGAMGLGFALPLVALSFLPTLQRLLPKPGAWMQTLKEGFAFPMFVTAAWATWIVGEQLGAIGVLVVMVLATALGFVVWALRTFKGPIGRSISILVAGLAVLAVIGATRPPSLEPQAWSPEQVEELLAQGRPVFVNFTADWCVTCQVNERSALSSARVAWAFGDRGVVYLKADWTQRDSTIAETLALYGRSGVPLYLYYSGSEGAQPVVLPQLLTEGAVLEAIQD
ncbi:MAG: protein-disulfide reductase DsbD family protein [Caulobacterales bacterium]